MQKRTIGLKCYITTPRHVTFLYHNRIELNENKDVFKDLKEFPPSYVFFPYEYIDAVVNNKLDKPKDDLQAMKCKRRLNITWNLLITIPTG